VDGALLRRGEEMEERGKKRERRRPPSPPLTPIPKTCGSLLTKPTIGEARAPPRKPYENLLYREKLEPAIKPPPSGTAADQLISISPPTEFTRLRDLKVVARPVHWG